MNWWKWLIAISTITFGLVFFWPLGIFLLILTPIIVKSINNKTKPNSEEESIKSSTTKSILPITGAYQKRWMFSYNEKDAFYKLKPIATELGYTVFAKVRLLDLLEPIKGNPKYKTYFYKVQSKHVDFVLCDEKLVAHYVIELDDSSHDSESRKQRDRFVDEVLESVGYKIIHTRAISEDIKKQLT